MLDLDLDSTFRVEFGEALSDAYPDGVEWDAHKGAAQRLVDAVSEALGWEYAGDVSRCSTALVLQRRSDGGFSVRPFGTCKRRWCPVCAWRLSRRRWARLVQRLPGLVQEHGPVKWLLLTLTIRNVPVESLKEGCRTLLDGFRRLTNSKTRLGRLWPATGWIRALEVTFPREGEAHPHLHVLMAVKPSYFSHGYVTHAEWVKRWREAARLDYDPIVDVRRVKPLNLPQGALPTELSEALGGLREVSKYLVKPSDWTPAAVAALTSVGRIRFIEGGGWLKGVFRDDDDDEGLEDVPDDPVEVATFWWRAAEWRYRRKL